MASSQLSGKSGSRLGTIHLSLDHNLTSGLPMEALINIVQRRHSEK